MAVSKNSLKIMKLIWKVVKHVFLIELNTVTRFPGHFVFLCQLFGPQVTTQNLFFFSEELFR